MSESLWSLDYRQFYYSALTEVTFFSCISVSCSYLYSLTESQEEQEVDSDTAESDTLLLHEATDTGTVTTVGRLLSSRELVLRRGLALGVTLTIFTTGVIIHVLLAKDS